MELTRRQFVSALSFAVATPLSPRLVSGTAAGSIGESRAIFDEGLNWASKSSAAIVCERIARAGFNVFMPCVWHGRGTIWPSTLAPWDSAAVRIPGFDPLGHLIEVARRFDLEIHPWFTVVRRDREFFQDYYDAGAPSESFDVHRKGFRDFIVSLILEVVRQYPVHGINLDYIRAGGICASPSCAADYLAQTGHNLLIDRAKALLPGGTSPELIAWQERAVEDIVLRVSTGARALNQKIVISVDAVPGHPIDLTQGRNSVRWADSGLVDVVYMMHYEANPDWAALRRLQQSMERPEALVVLCGNYEDVTVPVKAVVPRDAGKVATLLSEARKFQQGNGLGLYLYSRLSDQQVAELSAQTFEAKATPSWSRGVRPRS
ncbi:MAG: family 10 glycosylhydrolase [Nitrospira sp.]|nr:family 10 glycosylhydrolase [Nitrospira sp.]